MSEQFAPFPEIHMRHFLFRVSHLHSYKDKPRNLFLRLLPVRLILRGLPVFYVEAPVKFIMELVRQLLGPDINFFWPTFPFPDVSQLDLIFCLYGLSSFTMRKSVDLILSCPEIFPGTSQFRLRTIPLCHFHLKLVPMSLIRSQRH